MALVFVVSRCSLGGGDNEAEDTGEQTGAADTGPDVEAIRAAWGEQVSAACSERDTQIETVAQRLPEVVQGKGWAAAAEQLAPVEETLQESLSAAEPAPGDEAHAQQMAALYEEAGELRIQALRAKYVKRDRQFHALMEESENAREEAAAIATELGADGCAVEPPGPYATVDGLAAVRWGDRASTLCTERNRAFDRLRPTDTTRFEAVARRWLRQMRALRTPRQYARRIDRFLDQQVESARTFEAADAAFARGDNVAGEALLDKSNRLSSQSAKLMLEVGIEIGFERFCSAKPA